MQTYEEEISAKEWSDSVNAQLQAGVTADTYEYARQRKQVIQQQLLAKEPQRPLAPAGFAIGEWTHSSEQREETTTLEMQPLKQRTKTKVHGCNTILVDPGSMINIVGAETEKEFSRTAKENGLQVKYADRPNILKVNGVGEGHTACLKTASIPVAIRQKDRPTTVTTYNTNIATGCGEHLPAIIGSSSLREHNAVLILRKNGEETLVFPGEGGYKIQWEAGAQVMDLERAPSGHLVLPCDNFHDLTNQEPSSNFVMDFTTNVERQPPLE